MYNKFDIQLVFCLMETYGSFYIECNYIHNNYKFIFFDIYENKYPEIINSDLFKVMKKVLSIIKTIEK